MVLIATAVQCQYYDSDYQVGDHDNDDHSNYNEGDDRPDYSKYFKQDHSVPILSGQSSQTIQSTGFVNPSDFTGFFSSSAFGKFYDESN